MHQGRTYLCSHLDLGTRVAKVRPADIKYYTRVRDMADIHVTGGARRSREGEVQGASKVLCVACVVPCCVPGADLSSAYT